MSEQYIVHINRLCCAADIKNWTDSNRCYDIAEGTVRWCRVLRERECYWGYGRVRWFRVLRERESYWGYGIVRRCRVLRERVTGVTVQCGGAEC